MDNADIFILNGRNFYVSTIEQYDINLQNIEEFIKKETHLMPRMISFCDQIYYILKKTSQERAKELLILVSTHIKTSYLVRTLIGIINDIGNESIKYGYLYDMCTYSLINIGTEHSALECVKIRLFGADLMKLYDQHITNYNIFNFVIDSFVSNTTNQQIILKVFPKLELAMSQDKFRFKIACVLEKILSKHFVISYTNTETCCQLLYLIRNYLYSKEMTDVVSKCKLSHKNIKLMINKIGDKIFDVKYILDDELNKIKIINRNEKKYYSAVLLKIVETYENTNDPSLKKCCAYELEKYVNSESFWLKGYYTQHSDVTKKILKDEKLS